MALFQYKRTTDASSGTPRLDIPWRFLSLPFIAFLLLPLVALLFNTNAAALRTNLSDPVVLAAISISLKTSLITTLLVIVLGTPLAFLLARNRFPLRKLIDTLVDLPMVLPPAVAGVALLMAFGRRGMLGGMLTAFDLEIPFTQIAVVLAQSFVAGPLYIRSAIIGFAGIDNELEDAAIIDGAGALQLLRFITLPLSRNALLGGAVLTWARALGEFGATIIFAGNLPGETQTMPLAIYLDFQMDLSVALTLSVMLMGISFVVIVLAKYLLAR